MNRLQLQRIAKVRLAEARSLLKERQFDGSYYLAGYVIECALKACIAKQVRRHDFPDKRVVTESYTHDLEKLVRVAGLNLHLQAESAASPQLAVYWAIVKDWSEEARYSVGILQVQAENMVQAVGARQYGILPWLKKFW